MKYLITNKAHYAVNDNGETLEIYKVGCKVQFKDAGMLISSLGGIDGVREKLITEEEYLKSKAEKEAAAEERKSAAEQKEDALFALLKNPEATAKEILSAIRQALTKENGWLICSAFEGDNALTAALLNYGGSFTFTPYNNGEIVIKFDDGRRFSTSRRSQFKDTGMIAEVLK